MAFREPTGLLLGCLLVGIPDRAAAEAASLEKWWDEVVQPILEEYCYDCHGEGVKKGDLEIDRFESIDAMQAERELWKRIRSHINQQLMPPPDEPAPDPDERERITRWIDDAVFPVDSANPDPGRVTLRRLNRNEYENTVHDLLGIDLPLKGNLPPDDSGYGFDNNGDSLTLSPLHLERLLETARIALDEAIQLGPAQFPRRTILGRDLHGAGHPHGEERALSMNGEAVTSFEIPMSGEYQMEILAGGTSGGGVAPEMVVFAGDRKLGSFTVGAGMERPQPYRIEVSLGEGPVSVRVGFPNDFYDPENPDPNQRDRNLLVSRIDLVGPVDGPPPTKRKSHRMIYGERNRFDHDIDWAADIFQRFGRRAFRRPVSRDEVHRYLEFARLARDSGVDVEEGIRLGLEAMLVSPSFLYREEPQPEPDNPKAIHPIDEHALASRLSYFLWSTMPDHRLMLLADEGKLRENLDGEIDRMIRHRNFGEWVDGFAGQWLQLRDLKSIHLSTQVYPGFSMKLAQDMARETESLLAHVVREDLPITDLLEADYSFLNARLANHYGIAGGKDEEFRKVSLVGTPRRGIFGHGSFHMATSFPLRTSPVLRGKYVLENLLDQAPPPPPPNVPSLTPSRETATAATLRAQLERHRKDANCASCHALMDPIGFGLDRFDADGSYRSESNGQAIDVSGTLVGGRMFSGEQELREIILRDHREDFLRCVASKMLTYALGRGTDWYDKPAIDRIVETARAQQLSSQALLRAVVHSVPFQYRRGND